jgi:hypothetical protein
MQCCDKYSLQPGGKMELELMHCNLKNTKYKWGTVVIKYYKLPIFCELRYYVLEDKLWVRMPELWEKPSKKVQFAWWETKEESDEFQQRVLKMVCDKENLTLEEIKKFRQDWINEKKLNKKII